MNEKADDIKKRYQYRRLILNKKVSLSRKTATKLIGPDTAYHLYSHESAKKQKGKKSSK